MQNYAQPHGATPHPWGPLGQWQTPSITTTHLGWDARHWPIPFVNVHRATVAAALAPRSFPEAEHQPVVVILVPFQSDLVGYIYWSLRRASWVVNRQSMTDFAALRSRSSAATSRRSSASSLIRRFRHPLLKTLNSISAMFNQLPCVGV